jgi:catechol 2,3-dioxygenase-like lactoylglutathione lyase family enzyme
MLDHVGINCSDLAAAQAFYDKVLGVLGYSRVMDMGEYGSGYGVLGKPSFWVGTFPGVGSNREVHLAFVAADAAAVRAFYDAAVDAGAESLHAPRLWPEYHPGYYAAFVRDPDGNNVEAVIHHGGPED